MSKPLRPVLYDHLVRQFGKVIIANAGETMRASVTTDPAKRRLRLKVDLPGEYYRVNCPFCGDHRHRLWINHRWSQYVPALKSDNLFLAICYNDYCLSESGRARALRDHVFSNFLFGHQPDPVLAGNDPMPIDERPAKLPATSWPVSRIPDDWPAVAYLRSRGFDPQILSKQFRVCGCISEISSSHITHGRIIIPVYFREQLVGWQARCVGKPVDDNLPKYYTMPGMRKSQYLYNFDQAVRFPFVVVCEGATDVWSFGPEAVALFGKKISGMQTKLLVENWGQGAVVILLDGDAVDEAMEIHDALGHAVARKLIVALPAQKDPGDFSCSDLRALVFEKALAQGLDLTTLGRGATSAR